MDKAKVMHNEAQTSVNGQRVAVSFIFLLLSLRDTAGSFSYGIYEIIPDGARSKLERAMDPAEVEKRVDPCRAFPIPNFCACSIFVYCVCSIGDQRRRGAMIPGGVQRKFLG